MKFSTWDNISIQKGLSEDFIREHKNDLNWKSISRFQTLSEIFIEEHAEYVHWEWVSIFQKLSEPFIEKHLNKLDGGILQSQKLSLSFIEKLHDSKRFMSFHFWRTLSLNPYLTEEILETYQEKLWWHLVLQNSNLRESYILSLIQNDNDRLTEKFVFKALSENPHLTESFIEKYEDKWDWHSLIEHAKLSEIFIEKYMHKWTTDEDWHSISKQKNLSESFIRKHIHKWKTDETWHELFYHQEVSFEFIFEFIKTHIHRTDQYDLPYFRRNKKISKQQLQEIENMQKKGRKI